MSTQILETRVRLNLLDRMPVQFASQEIKSLLGFTPEDLLTFRVNLKERIHAHDSQLAEALFRPETQSGSGTFNLRIRHADGRIRCIKAHATKKEEGGQIVLELLLQDVRSLQRESDPSPMLAKFTAMMENAEEYIYFKDRNHVFTTVSKKVTAHSLLHEKTISCLGHTDYDFMLEEYADIYYRLEDQVLAGISSTHHVHKMTSSQGRIMWMDDRKYPVRNSDGEIIGLFGIARDITEQVHAEETLRESEEQLRESQAIAGLGSYVLDIGKREVKCSELMNEIFGVRKDLVKSLDEWSAIIHPEDLAEVRAYFQDKVLDLGKDFDHQCRIIRPSDQAVRWVHGLGRLEFDAQRRPVKMRGTIQDITESKLSETALRESKELLQLFIEHAPVSLAMFDREMRYLAASRRWLDIHSFGDREIAGHSLYELSPDIPECWKEINRRGLAGEVPEADDLFLPSENGSGRWFRRGLHPWRTSDGEVGGIVIFSEDITQRKQAEIDLSESKELLQEFIDHAPVSLAMFDCQMRYLAVSKQYLKGYSLKSIDIIGRSYYEIFPHIPECWKEAHLRGLSGEELQVNEDQYEDADGTEHWIRWQLHPWRRGNGAVGGVVIFSEDITQRRQAEIALNESTKLLQFFIEHAPAALAMFDAEMRYLAVSNRYREYFSLVGAEIIGRSHYEVTPFISERWKEIHRYGLAGKVMRADEDFIVHADGSEHWIRWEMHPWRTGNGTVGGIVIFSEDITERRKTEEKLRLAASVFTHAREGILITRADGAIIEVNEMFCQITGYSREEVVGRNPRLLNSGHHDKEFYEKMWRTLLESGHWSGEIWNRNKDGRIYAEMLTISAVHDERNEVQQYVALFSDITTFKDHERQLEHYAHHDMLTGLPNRVLLGDRLNQAIAHSNRRRKQVVVAYLDLDGFKEVNDTHGHEAGDQLLAVVAGRMKAVLREGDTLARMGGDEFIAVLLDLESTESSLPLLTRLLRAASQPVLVGKYQLKVTASIGVTTYPQVETADADLLLRQADQAMYQAKLAGKNRYYIFNFKQDRNARNRQVDINRIRQGISNQEFVLYYQPKVNMCKGTVVGAEALIRWQHPERGLMPPGSFLPVIEDHPVAIVLGEWVIDTALTQMERWQAAGLNIPVSVNVGARQLQEPDFADRLAALLVAHPHVKPSSLELEIVETSALEEMDQVSQMLEGCRELGVMFALDDFGTGYSSLSYLKQLPADVLKIDQSFVRNILEDPEDLTILEGVLGLATAFRRSFIAEGVETAEQGLMLLRMGCELAQGFGIARPMPAEDFPHWAATWKPDPRWANVKSANEEERQLIYAAVEHRSWILAIEAFLKGERHVPPRLSVDQCRFSLWMTSEGFAEREEKPEFQQLEKLHEQIHALAVNIVKYPDREINQNLMARLSELHSLRDALLEQLEVYKKVCHFQ
jgi:diguanylate cyclase (GGDEF)-like protein/PAS domain S-box-containing protein